jgi:hypothetical protein
MAVVATAVAGAVFALTSDLVIGVGAGAAVFALVRQAHTVWGKGNNTAAGVTLTSGCVCKGAARGSCRMQFGGGTFASTAALVRQARCGTY